jgi:hypothetical protein
MQGPHFMGMKNDKIQNENNNVEEEQSDEKSPFEEIKHQDTTPNGSFSELSIGNDDSIPYSTIFSLQNKFKNFGLSLEKKVEEPV